MAVSKCLIKAFMAVSENNSAKYFSYFKLIAIMFAQNNSQFPILIYCLLASDGANQQSSVRFFCKTCPYIFQVDKKISIKMELPRKQVDDVLGGEEAFEGVDETDAKCPRMVPFKCDGERAYFIQFQCRGGDEPMSRFYKCKKCKY